MGGGQISRSSEERTHRVLASWSLSKVFCLFSSSRRVAVTSFSLGFDSAVVMGRVTPRYLEWGGPKTQHREKEQRSARDCSRFVVLESHRFGVCRRMSGLKLQVFVEVQTQPTRGVCRHADTLKPDSPNRKRVHSYPLFSLSTG